MSEDIEFACPYCDKVSSVPSSFAGKRGKCPNCKKILEVPDPFAAQDAPDAYVVGEPAGGPVAASASRPIKPSFDGRGGGGGGGGGGTKECSFCGERIKSVAKKCKHCGEYLDRRLRNNNRMERRRQPADNQDMNAGEWLLAILCPGIGCIYSIIILIQGKKRGGMMLAVSLIMSVIGAVINVAISGAR